MTDAEETKQHSMPDAVATMTFNLDTPEGRFAHRCACRGQDMLHLLWDLDQEMRGCVKHGSALFNLEKELKHREGIEMATEHWRDRLRDLALDLGVDLEDDV
jgi:Zn ribbon nucleic-acid-binding protein